MHVSFDGECTSFSPMNERVDLCINVYWNDATILLLAFPDNMRNMIRDDSFKRLMP